MWSAGGGAGVHRRSSITVELCEPGHVRGALRARAAGKGHVVFRVGEVHGRVTDRAEQVRETGGLCGWLAGDE